MVKTKTWIIAACAVLLTIVFASVGCASSQEPATTTIPGLTSTTETTTTSLPSTETSPTSTTTTMVTTTLAVTTTLRTSTTGVPVPAFEWSIQPIDAGLEAEMLQSGAWRPGVPASMDELLLIRVTHWGFDGKVHTGRLVVNGDWAEKLGTVFLALYEARFPIKSIQLIDAYGADDERSMAADNSSAFNGRYVSGRSVWSMHAYGLAVDINPVENPWVDGADVSPASGRRYVDRSLKAPGMIHAGDAVVQAFESIGWKWGGYWSGIKDYQHFSSNGR